MLHDYLTTSDSHHVLALRDQNIDLPQLRDDVIGPH
jgi:hypothetical protein